MLFVFNNQEVKRMALQAFEAFDCTKRSCMRVGGISGITNLKKMSVFRKIKYILRLCRAFGSQQLIFYGNSC